MIWTMKEKLVCTLYWYLAVDRKSKYIVSKLYMSFFGLAMKQNYDKHPADIHYQNINDHQKVWYNGLILAKKPSLFSNNKAFLI